MAPKPDPYANLNPVERFFARQLESGLNRFFGKPRFTPEQFRALSVPTLQRSAAAQPGSNPLAGDPTGRYIPGSMQRPIISGTDIISGSDIGGDGRGEQYRQQLSQYTPKVFPMTAEGQQERYFGTPEFNYVFGAQTGKGPKTAEEMRTLAAQTKAPTGTPLSDYYRSQSAMGRVNQADIQAMYADRPDLQKWAAANPMLAQREFVKRRGAQVAQPTTGPSPFEIMGAMEKGQYYPSEGSPFPMERITVPGVANPVTPTVAFNQAAAVDENAGLSFLKDWQRGFTSGGKMPFLPKTTEYTPSWQPNPEDFKPGSWKFDYNKALF